LVKNDQFFVEEVSKDDEQYFRRLVFANEIDVFKDQVRMTYYNKKNQDKQHLKDSNSTLKTIMPEKNTFFIGIDDSYLDSELYRTNVVHLAFFDHQYFIEKRLKTLIIGTGLYSLSNFLSKYFQNYLDIVVLEKHQELTAMCKKHFELQENQNY